jgi:hypothetical protein
MLLPHSHYKKRGLEGLLMTVIAGSLAIGVAVFVGMELMSMLSGVSDAISNLGEF